MDRDAFRTETVLILCIFPGLGSGYFGDLHFMGVGHIEAVHRGLLIVVDRILGNGIFDLFSVFIFNRKIGKIPSPVILCRHSLTLVGLFIICQQMDGDLLRTSAVLVVRIIPGLDTCNIGLARCTGIRHIEAVDLGLIIINRILGNSVNDLLSGSIFIQTGKAVGPVSVLVRFYRLDFVFQFLTIRIQTDRNTLRTETFCILFVIPGLGSDNILDLLRYMCVRHIETIHRCLIPFNFVLSDGIIDLFSVRIFRKIRKAVRPVTVFVCGHGLTVRFFPVGKQMDNDVSGTEAVLIIIIFPGLGSGYGCQRGRRPS